MIAAVSAHLEFTNDEKYPYKEGVIDKQDTALKLLKINQIYSRRKLRDNKIVVQDEINH